RQAAGNDTICSEVSAFEVGDMHRAAPAAAVSVFLAEEFRKHACRVRTLGDAMTVAAMGRKDVVVGTQRQDSADGARLLADRQVHGAVDEAAHVACLGSLLELA